MLLCFEGLDVRSKPCMFESVSMRSIGEDLRSISGCVLLNGILKGAGNLTNILDWIERREEWESGRKTKEENRDDSPTGYNYLVPGLRASLPPSVKSCDSRFDRMRSRDAGAGKFSWEKVSRGDTWSRGCL
jgi:hypothetical protein